jgi:hypothetical protein
MDIPERRAVRISFNSEVVIAEMPKDTLGVGMDF